MKNKIIKLPLGIFGKLISSLKNNTKKIKIRTNKTKKNK